MLRGFEGRRGWLSRNGRAEGIVNIYLWRARGASVWSTLIKKVSVSGALARLPGTKARQPAFVVTNSFEKSFAGASLQIDEIVI